MNFINLKQKNQYFAFFWHQVITLQINVSKILSYDLICIYQIKSILYFFKSWQTKKKI